MVIDAAEAVTGSCFVPRPKADCGIVPNFGATRGAAGRAPMGKTTLIIIAYGLAAAAANLIGGLFVSSRKLGQATLRYLIALGAGFMMAAVFLKIVPETIEQWPGSPLVPMTWLLGGYLLIQFVEHTVAPHFHFGKETHEEASQRNRCNGRSCDERQQTQA